MRLGHLGYATTTHTAQGVTADTCHGLLTGDETRQQAYTMLTRGRLTNTAYLVSVGDGDPHTLIHPDTINPATPTDELQRILARDESPISATTTIRQAGEPARLLGAATDRYRDAIVFAATHIIPEIERRALERSVDRLLAGITRAPAWPALFSQLLTIAADNRDPVAALVQVAERPISVGGDPAATLAGRLDDTSHHRAARGPLPWLNPIPAKLIHDPHWGAYLATRAERVSAIARRVHEKALTNRTMPGWVADGVRPPSSLVADIEVWRAANNVPESDRRPTGERHHGGGPGRHQGRLERRLASLGSPALDEWGELLGHLDTGILRDDFATTLATRVARLSSAGIDARALLSHAMTEGTLPDDHAAAALWWRVSGRLSPAVTQAADTEHHLCAHWLPDLQATVGEQTVDELRASTWWPALVATIEHGLQRGWTLQALVCQAPVGHERSADTCQAWVWRLNLATSPMPPDDFDIPPELDSAPDDLYTGWQAIDYVTDMVVPDPLLDSACEEAAGDEADIDHPDWEAERILALEALVRRTMRPPELTPPEIRRQQDRANAWLECPYTPERLVYINELATQYFESRLPGSWAQPYLAERLCQDITGHPQVRPGYAPDGWTTLVEHLQRHGVSDLEILTAGVATIASTGRLIDRFRDRVVFPISKNGHVLGFVGRRNPEDADDGKHGPKYLNTGDTPLFHKGDQLYIVGDSKRGKPVLVEGPIDAIAVTVATGGACLGAAPLGTSLTAEQAGELVTLNAEPIIATDADAAGLVAAERDFWILAARSASPLFAELPSGRDPADLLALGSAAALARAIEAAEPLGHHLMQRHLMGGQTDDVLQATRMLAAMPPSYWTAGIGAVADSIGLPPTLIRVTLASAVAAWNQNPGRAALLWGVDQHRYSDRTDARRNQDARSAAILRPTGRDLPMKSEESQPALGAP